MKNYFKLYVLALILFAGFQTNAQIGIRAGVNLSDFSVSEASPEYKSGTKIGLGVGLFYKLPLAGGIALQPEVNFMQHGTKAEIDFLGIKATNTLSLNYIQIPILLKVGFGDMDATNFYVQAGPYVGMGIGKVKSKTCIDGKCETEDGDYDKDGIEGPRSTDYGVQLGAGVNINSNISLDARYILGLANLSGDGVDGTLKNTGINISIGYAF